MDRVKQVGTVRPLVEGRGVMKAFCPPPPPGINKVFFASLCLAAAVFAAGCGATGIGNDSDPFDTTPPVLKAFPLTAHDAVLFKERGPLTISALLTPEVAGAAIVEWSVSEANIVSLDASGAHATITPAGKGQTTLTAKLSPREGYVFDEKSELVSECRITVLEDFTLAEEDMLFFAGETAAQDAETGLSLQELGALNRVAVINWSSTGGGAQIPAESAGSSVAVKAGSVGTATVRATLAAKNAAEGSSAPDFNGDGLSAPADVTTLAVPSLALDDIGETMLNAGTGSAAEKGFDVTAHYPSTLDAYKPEVVWSSGDAAKASVAARAANPISGGDAHGSGTAKAVGTPVISAVLKVAGRSFGPVSKAVNIVAYVAPVRPVANVVISGNPNPFLLKQTATSVEITAKALHSDGNPPDNKNIIWTQNGSGSVTINPVNSSDANVRKITITGGNPGPVTITATAQDDAGKKAAFTVTVQAPAVTWTTATPAKFTYGGFVDLGATTDITNKGIKWSVTAGDSYAALSTASGASTRVAGITGSPVKTSTPVKVKAASEVNAASFQEHPMTMEPHTFTVKYDSNGATSGTTADQGGLVYGSSTALKANGFSKTGWTFDGWTETKNGAAKLTKAGDLDNNAAAKTPSGTVTVYALWKLNSYTVRYEPNGAGGSAITDSVNYDANHTIRPADTFSAPTSKAFKEWRTASNGTGTLYTPGSTVKNLAAADGAVVPLYAIWELIPVITYNANGGLGDDKEVSQLAGTSHKTLAANLFTPPNGMGFKEWNTKTDGTGTKYAAGNAFSVSADTKLYAIWLTLGAVASGQNNAQDLMVKFGIKTSGYTSWNETDVTNTFHSVKIYINKSGITGSNEASQSAKLGNIALGDYVDLPSLTVLKYGDTLTDALGGGLSVTNDPSARSDRLRLMVVGVNTYKGKNSNEAGNHLVFHFKGIPGTRRMYENQYYNGSAMAKYLRENFLPGLVAAGLPESAVWEPKRVVGRLRDDANPQSVTGHKLWLPTTWETVGTYKLKDYDTLETAENQGQFWYYGENALREKGGRWWLATPQPEYGWRQNYCAIADSGKRTTADSTIIFDLGVVPAFCIK